jgi:hypothetical protein
LCLSVIFDSISYPFKYITFNYVTKQIVDIDFSAHDAYPLILTLNNISVISSRSILLEKAYIYFYKNIICFRVLTIKA